MSYISVQVQDQSKVKITDQVERRQAVLEASSSVNPQEISTDEFQFPVDFAFSIRSESIKFPFASEVNVRDQLGLLIEEVREGETRELPEGRYSLNLSGPVKLYIIVDSQIAIHVSGTSTSIDVEGDAEFHIGIRSYHKHPAATISVTKEPEVMMKAISKLSSSLKTTTAERSYPTLRGHPPVIEIGDESNFPTLLSSPQTGVKIQVPSELEYIYPIAPLAYYLGATVVPGSIPKISTDSGFEFSLLETDRDYEIEAERVLKQVFFLDCITRTEGIYPVNLHGKSELESRVNVDFYQLYDQPISKQLEEYLSIPYNDIEDLIPIWKKTVRMESVPENIEIIPFLVSDLASIRTKDRPSFNHGYKKDRIDRQNHEYLDRSWAGEGIQENASKELECAYLNRLERGGPDEPLELNVVINRDNKTGSDAQLDNEFNKLPMEVTIHRETDVNKLVDILEKATGIFVYFGHIDENGLACADGILDLSQLNRTAIDIFYLDGESYSQGVELIEAGSLSGIVNTSSASPVHDHIMVRDLVHLIFQGLPLRTALERCNPREKTNSFVILGNGTLSLSSESGSAPSLVDIKERNSIYEMNYEIYPSKQADLGSIVIPYVQDNHEFYLVPGIAGPFTLSGNELIEFTSIENMPVQINNQLIQSADIDEYIEYDTDEDTYSASGDLQNLNHKFENINELNLTRRLEIFNEALQEYHDIGLESLPVEGILNLEIISIHGEIFNYEYLKRDADTLIDALFERRGEAPIISSQSYEFEESLSVNKTREILRDRQNLLKSIANNAFDEVNENVLKELQHAYLLSIWKNIDFENSLEFPQGRKKKQFSISSPEEIKSTT